VVLNTNMEECTDVRTAVMGGLGGLGSAAIWHLFHLIIYFIYEFIAFT